MSPQPESLTQEVLAGLIERVTYHNAENGFCVLRTKARGHRDVVTVVGYAAAISAGEWITASGEWVNDRTHGQQFRARFLRTSPPTSADGIEKYLSSGMIRGIGPVYAKKLVRSFGEKVFDVIAVSLFRTRAWRVKRGSVSRLPGGLTRLMEPCQQHGEDAGEKDAVEGAGAADRRNWSAKTLHLVEIGEVGTDQGAHAARDVRKRRCVDARKQ